MHELGVLRQIVKTIIRIADESNIRKLKYIALEVGDDSGFVPYYLTKLFPIAADDYPLLHNTELRISMTGGKGLIIKEIGY